MINRTPRRKTMTRITHSLFLFLALVVAVTAAFAAAPGQARATDGSGSEITCPSYAPYVHVNAFGKAFCSKYP
jgi:hypothetical protein